MLGHLVFGRYGAAGERDEHVTHSQKNWVERMMGVLFHRRPRR